MFLLRLQAVVSNQPQIQKQVAVYYAEGVTPAVLYKATDETPISNLLTTDASGFILFKMTTLTTLTFKVLTGLSLSAAAYPLYSGGATPPPQINPIPVAYWEEVVLTPAHINAKSIILTYTPIPESLEVLSYLGILQERNLDYTLAGNVISWNSLALELLLEVGDTLRITYHRAY